MITDDFLVAGHAEAKRRGAREHLGGNSAETETQRTTYERFCRIFENGWNAAGDHLAANAHNRVSDEIYSDICTIVDRVKSDDDRSLDTDEYASLIVDAVEGIARPVRPELPETTKALVAAARDLIGDDIENVDDEYIRAQAELIASVEPIPGIADGDAKRDFVRALITAEERP